MPPPECEEQPNDCMRLPTLAAHVESTRESIAEPVKHRLNRGNMSKILLTCTLPLNVKWPMAESHFSGTGANWAWFEVEGTASAFRWERRAGAIPASARTRDVGLGTASNGPLPRFSVAVHDPRVRSSRMCVDPGQHRRRP
jgi:hypothetical protein